MIVISGVVSLALPMQWIVSGGLLALAALGGLLNGLGALTSFAVLEHAGRSRWSFRSSIVIRWLRFAEHGFFGEKS